MKKTLHSIIAIILVLFSFNASATVHEVMVVDYAFTPASLTVNVGDTIHWVKGAGSTHTTTSGVIPAGAATWDATLDQSSNNFYYHVTVAGNYGYTCTIHSMKGSFVAVGATGIAQGTANANLGFYPNPFKGELNMSFTSATTENGVVSIYDLTGKEVYQIQLQVTAGLNSVVLPLSNLDRGMYIAQVTVAGERVGSRRVTKE